MTLLYCPQDNAYTPDYSDNSNSEDVKAWLVSHAAHGVPLVIDETTAGTAKAYKRKIVK